MRTLRRLLSLRSSVTLVIVFSTRIVLADCTVVTGDETAGCTLATTDQSLRIQAGGALTGWVNMTGARAALNVENGGTFGFGPAVPGAGASAIALAAPNQTLTNNGTMMTAGNHFVDLISPNGTGFMIINGTSGVMASNNSAPVANVIHSFAAGVSGTLINSGTISATGGANEGVIFMSGAGGTMNVENRLGGIIHGDVAVAYNVSGNKQTNLRNAGTISTSVANGTAIGLGSGTDTVTIESTSAITGIVNGQGGVDTLALGGTAVTGNFNIAQIGPAAQYRNFEVFQKVEPGTWTLTGTGATATSWTATDGTLRLSSSTLGLTSLVAAGGDIAYANGVVISSPTILNAATHMIVDGTDGATQSGVVSGTGAATKGGNGTLVLAGANTYTGGTTIEAGTLQLGNGGTSGSLEGDVANNAALLFNRGNALSYGGHISGTGEVSQIGAGTTILTGNNTYQGATTVAAGALYINGDQTGAIDLTTATSGSTLGGTGTIGGNVLVEDGATLSPGGVGSTPGTLTVNGSLSLGSGSNLAYSFGQGNIAGGPFNDLTTVGDNLTLDGTLNVAGVPGGTFDAGVYRIFNYSGTLNNQGLALGMGTSPDQFIQTSVAGQVNLVNTAGLTLNFWDGALGPKNNAEVNGGNGLWQRGNDNWTHAAGVVNAPFSDGSFAVFMAKPGLVTVDNNLGQVRISGMQFASDGYYIDGGSIALVGSPSTTVRVGAGYTATINSVLTGMSQLVKADLGSLVLGAANTYSGGTAINGGVLQVSSDANLGASASALNFDDGTLRTTADISTARATTLNAAGGTFETQAGTLTHNGIIVGAGALTKTASGTLVTTGANSYTGLTTIVDGTLRAGAAGTFSAASSHSVAPGATLATTGFDQRLATLSNNGTVSLVGAAAGSTITVNQAYGGQGFLRLNTGLVGGVSVSDRLVLDGPNANASGNTTIQIASLGGLGALTTGNGIEVVSGSNGAITTAQTSRNAFSLANGHVDAGAFEYRLYAADASGAGENWYLRSTLPILPPETPPTNPSLPVLPTYRAEVPLLAALPAQLRQADLAMLGNLHQRIGDEFSNLSAPNASEMDEHRAWMRLVYSDLNIRQPGVADAHSQGHVSGLQLGTDLLVSGDWQAGAYVGYLDGSAGVSGNAHGIISHAGNNDLQSRYLGIYATRKDASGFYVDSVLQGSSQHYTVRPSPNPSLKGKASSLAASVETGKPFALSDRWSLEPQAQLIYQYINPEDLKLSGAQVRQDADSGWIGRLGVRITGDVSSRSSRLLPYARLNFYQAFFNNDVATFTGPAGITEINSAGGYRTAEAAVGTTLTLTPAIDLYGEIGEFSDLGGDAKVKSSAQASLGMKVRW